MNLLYLPTILLLGQSHMISGYMGSLGVFQLQLKSYKNMHGVDHKGEMVNCFTVNVKIGKYSRSVIIDEKILDKSNALIFSDTKYKVPVNVRLPAKKTHVELNIEVLKSDRHVDNRRDFMKEYYTTLIQHVTLTEDWIKKTVLLRAKDGKRQGQLVYQYRIKCDNNDFKGSFCTRTTGATKLTRRSSRMKRSTATSTKVKTPEFDCVTGTAGTTTTTTAVAETTTPDACAKCYKTLPCQMSCDKQEFLFAQRHMKLFSACMQCKCKDGYKKQIHMCLRPSKCECGCKCKRGDSIVQLKKEEVCKIPNDNMCSEVCTCSVNANGKKRWICKPKLECPPTTTAISNSAVAKTTTPDACEKYYLMNCYKTTLMKVELASSGLYIKRLWMEYLKVSTLPPPQFSYDDSLKRMYVNGMEFKVDKRNWIELKNCTINNCEFKNVFHDRQTKTCFQISRRSNRTYCLTYLSWMYEKTAQDGECTKFQLMKPKQLRNLFLPENCSKLSNLSEKTGFINVNGSFGINAQCHWRIIGKPGKLIRLQFLVLNMVYQRGCPKDKLVIYEVNGSTENEKRKMCGESRPEDLFAGVGTSILIKFFKINVGKSYKFLIKYDFISPNLITEIAPGSTYHCNKAGNITATNGFIYSHKDFENHKYLSFMRCEWHILGQPGKRFRLHFNSFSLERKCRCDHLSIYNDVISSERLIWRKCGGSLPADLYSEVGKGFSLVFISDNNDEHSGFNISYDVCTCNPSGSTKCQEPCNCLKGYKDRSCNTCEDEYYENHNYENRSCKPCPCNQLGSFNCTPPCQCRQGYLGDKCDKCSDKYYRNATMGCRQLALSVPSNRSSSFLLLIGIYLSELLIYLS